MDPAIDEYPDQLPSLIRVAGAGACRNR